MIVSYNYNLQDYKTTKPQNLGINPNNPYIYVIN